ncbi:hypothetical protein BDQ12DRAFT_725084 [Crucibulum laeve]|uniref:Uncharacterized protein n=1 Tax=Crucibulum laeve TaxID=68775 RepID=A0A5C3LU36_9AGAR|nr:hypothetical protein BDQ12DRAFT_725084 [Crucibulum laeve]
MDACIYNILERPIWQGEVLSEAGGSIILPSTNGHPYHWIVMSPNTNYILPLPTGIQRVQPRTNGHLGLDNQTITPQLYTQNFKYTCCILKWPDNLNHPLWILWTTVRLTNTLMVEGVALDLEMWVLKPDFLETLRCVQDALVMRPTEYKTVAGRQSNGGNILAATIDHLFSCLSMMGMTWKELVLAMAEFQRSCLDIKGWFHFMVKYWPHLMGPFCDEEIANDVMGAFTQDVVVLQELHKMWIPCWYIQPSFCLLDHTAIGDHQYIDKLPCTVMINQFTDSLGNPDPYPILWEGLLCTEMWEQTQCLGCQMKNLTKPSAIGIREVCSTVGELSLPSSNEWMQLQGPLDAGQSLPCQDAGTPVPPVKLHPLALTPSGGSGTSKSALPGVSGSSKKHVPLQFAPGTINPTRGDGEERQFKDPKIAAMPPPIEAWMAGLQAVVRSPNHIAKVGSRKIGFFFPDPHAFESNNGTLYTMTWLASRAFYMYCLLAGDMSPIAMQHWCTWLARLEKFFGPAASLPMGALAMVDRLGKEGTSTSLAATRMGKEGVMIQEEVSTVSKRGRDDGGGDGKAPAKKKRKPRMRNSTQSNPQLNDVTLRTGTLNKIFWFETTIMSGSREEVKQQLTPEIMSEVLWELCECGFRHELLALDKVMAPLMWKEQGILTKKMAEADCNKAVQDVFPFEGYTRGNYLLEAIPNKNKGLALIHWQSMASPSVH